LYSPRIYDHFFAKKTEVTIYTPRDVFDERLFDEFAKNNGLSVRVTYFDTNEEMLAKFKISRGVGYDLVVPSDYMVELLIKEKLLQKIDKSKLSNFNELDSRLLNKFYDKKNEFSIPAAWIPYGIGFNKKFFDLDNNVSWSIIFEGKGLGNNKISMLNDPREVLFLSSLYLFNSVRPFTPDRMNKIKDLLIKQKKHVEAYMEAGAKALLLSEIVPIAVLPAARMKEMGDTKNYGFVIPREGSLVDIITIGILATSKKADLAYKVIDFLISKEIGAYNFEAIACNPANKESYDLIKEEYSQNKAYFPDDEMFKRLKVLHNDVSPLALEKLWFLVKTA
jgi:spermidine/putrescine transport system substrate-binding protein